MDADAVVIGAGVVGLACARELAARGRDVVIIERHERFGVETSSRNSEVIHAGIYYPAGSLKARLCVAGSRRLYAWCAEHGIPHARIGKLIVASTADEEPRLDEILRQAEANGVSSLRPLSAADVRALEPHVRATRGLWSPDTGIVDSHQLMASLLADAEGRGGTAAWRHEVVGADPLRGGGFGVTARSDGETTRIEARTVVNAAGLDADLVAAYPGLDARAAGYALHFARGHYFRVHPRKAHLARHLVYPTPRLSHLGIHVTLDLAGGVRLGPDAEYLPGRVQDYAVSTGLRDKFHAAASRYLEGLEPEDLSPDLAGIRPKLQGPGEPFRDFVIAEESARGFPGWINLVGIESPGLTCCLAIATAVADLLEDQA
ncbi:MAG TPA: NAD(P)/FAD-dependent oxidoreductase [Gemmatimonadales bacterium]|nr:NAD(P)/FAD-dependent oxidoreductase [Gemmatimonadales bacterium]